MTYKTIDISEEVYKKLKEKKKGMKPFPMLLNAC